MGSFLLVSTFVGAQTRPQQPTAGQTAGERRGELNLKAARANPLQLRSFLKKMPKGADLHNHLSGAVYAESWIRAAAEDHLCVNVASLSFAKSSDDRCASGTVPAENASNDQHLYDALIDAFSMRGFVPSSGVTGHDHFFDTFAKFGGTDRRHLGEWLDEIASRADSQNEQYLELMHTPEFAHAASIANEIGWQEDLGENIALRAAMYHWLVWTRKTKPRPGDIILMDTFPNRAGPDHIGILSDRVDDQGLPLVINNWTDGTVVAEMDLLTFVPVLYRFRLAP